MDLGSGRPQRGGYLCQVIDVTGQNRVTSTKRNGHDMSVNDIARLRRRQQLADEPSFIKRNGLHRLEKRGQPRLSRTITPDLRHHRISRSQHSCPRARSCQELVGSTIGAVD